MEELDPSFVAQPPVSFAMPLRRGLGALHSRALTTSTDFTFPASIKGAETALAFISTSLVGLTYGILIGAGGRMATTSKLPLKSIQANIGTLLSKTWPDSSSSPDIGAVPGDSKDAIRLLYLGRMNHDYNNDDPNQRAAKGLRQCEASPFEILPMSPLWLTSGSPTTKSIIQLAVWEWLSVWLCLIMVFVTLLYNGFFFGDTGPDSFPRLTVVLIYAVVFCTHAVYISHACCSFLTLAAAGASWSLLELANFAVVDSGQFSERLRNPSYQGSSGSSVDFWKVGKANMAVASMSYNAFLAHEDPDQRVYPATDADETSETQKDLRSAINTLNSSQEDERVNVREAASVALDRVLTNALMLVSIAVSTGFAAWTSRLSSNDSKQLGSLALLGSVSFGVGAMMSSAVQLSVMNSSFAQIISVKEIKINGQALEHFKKRQARSTPIGFSFGTAKARAVKLRDLINPRSFREVILFLVFGPAYSLLPSAEDHARQSSDTQFNFHISVRGRPVVLTTMRTDKHITNADEVNVETINVCCQPMVSDSSPWVSGTTRSEVKA
jgi:hypothetical protein